MLAVLGELLLSLTRACGCSGGLSELADNISDFYIYVWVITPSRSLPERRVVWLGSSLRDLRSFDQIVRRAIGRKLRRLQQGTQPTDWKPLPSVGIGVIELRTHADGEQRAVVLARFSEAVYVLHVFEKKSAKTPRRDLDVARRRYRDLISERSRR